jgi:ring-1,2-phenylacetyl-CoA epoxidase subunit PaaC
MESHEENLSVSIATTRAADLPVFSEPVRKALFEYLLRLGDDRLILGHRLSEWCGHGPILEEDLALGNVALDLIGHAQAFLALAGRVEGKQRDEDKLAYFRGEREVRNAKLSELPRGDFAFTIARQFIFDCYSMLLMEQLQQCRFPELAGLAAKTLKEDSYHYRHSAQWILRLGDGTDESRSKIQTAIGEIWAYSGELFVADEVEKLLLKELGVPDPSTLLAAWSERVGAILKEATLDVPPNCFMHTGGRKGLHTEHLGKLLAEMQVMPRSYPDARW